MEFIRKNKTAVAYILAGVLLAIMFCLSFFASRGDSGTVDEIAHIPSGYSYIAYHDYRLNPEHPPLAKALAGIPLAFMKLNGFSDHWTWDSIDQWDSGWYFLYQAGNNPVQMFTWARFPMILLMLGLGLLLFKWASEWYGRKVGLFVLALYAFYPDILGHGHLVTTDVPAAFGFTIAIYAFDKMLRKQTWQSVLWAGLAFGLAQLLKFSAFLLFGVFLILILYKAYTDRAELKGYGKAFWKYLKQYFWVCVTSVLTVWAVYIPLIYRTSAAVEHKVIEINMTSDARTLILRNFLHHFEGNVITRALGHYILGIFLVIARVAGGNAVYIMGHLSDKSISWFFPVAYVIKTPIPILLFFAIAITLAITIRSKNKEQAWRRWLILTPVIVYWAFTLKGQLNIGIRHLIPTIPFVLLFIGGELSRFINDQRKITVQKILIAGFTLLLMIDVFFYYPQYIAYFNEFVPRFDRYKYMTDSSLDWGQDLYRLRDYVKENNISEIKVDYFGGSVPQYFIPGSSEWHSSYGPTTGWLAVSATYYQSSKLYGPKEGKWSYSWLDNFTPTAEIGGSILVYNITPQELIENYPVSPYPITHFDVPGSLNLQPATPTAQN